MADNQKRNQEDTFVHDDRGNVVRQTRSGVVTEYERDSLGNVLRETRDGETTEYEYDALRNITQRTVSGTVVERSLFNEVGWLISRSSRHHTVAYQHDAEGNVVNLRYSAGLTDA